MKLICFNFVHETDAATFLDNVDDSTRNEINMLIESMNHTTEVFAEIAPLPEEKQLAITSQIYNNKLQTLNSIYIKLNKNKEE